MTSKERVTAALEGRIPDRVPYAEFAVDFDTVERILTCVHDPVRDARIFTAAEFEKEPEPLRRDERSWRILGASHSVAVGTKYDNFMAMLDEHEKLCHY